MQALGLVSEGFWTCGIIFEYCVYIDSARYDNTQIGFLESHSLICNYCWLIISAQYRRVTEGTRYQ